MKHLKLFVFLVFISFPCFAINDVSKLNETIQAFIQPFFADSLKMPEAFVLTLSEFKTCYKLQTGKEADGAIEKDYTGYYLKNIDRRSLTLKDEIGKVQSMMSFETFRYFEPQAKDNKQYFMDVSIVFKIKRPHSSMQEDSVRTVFKFVLLGNQLKLTGQFREISRLHYRLQKLQTLTNMGRYDFGTNFKGKYFESSKYKCIPYKFHNKWGLVSFSGKQLVKPVYDSIYPFVANYALVVEAGKYNLIDTSFKPVFNQGKKKIKLINGKYAVLNNKNLYEPFPYQPKTTAGSIQQYEGVGSDNFLSPGNTKTDDPVLSLYADSISRLYDIYYKNWKKIECEVNRSWSISQQEGRNVYYVVDRKTKDTVSVLRDFEYVDPHGAFLYGFKNDTGYVLLASGKILFQTPCIASYNANRVDLLDENTSLLGMYCPSTNVYILPRYRFIRPAEDFSFFVVITQSGELSYLNERGREISDVE